MVNEFSPEQVEEFINSLECESIDILVDFHNINIEPDLFAKAGKILIKEDIARVIRFLNRNLERRPRDQANLISVRSLGSDYKTEVRSVGLSGDPMAAVLIGYRRNNGMDWFDNSDDLKTFVDAYLMVRKVTRNLLENQYNTYIEKWFGNLWITLMKTRLESELKGIEAEPPFQIAAGLPFQMRNINDKSILDSDRWWNLKDLECTTYGFASFDADWCGLPIHHIGMSICIGFAEILRRRRTIRRCVVDACNRIFAVPNRGRGYKRKYCDEHRNDKYRKRVARDPDYRNLAKYIAEWLEKGEQVGERVRASTFDDPDLDKFVDDPGLAMSSESKSLAGFVREKYDPKFKLPSMRVAKEFVPKRLNPFLKEHGFRLEQKKAGKQDVYWFERIMSK